MAKEKGLAKIHEFDPLVYPRKVWIAVNPSMEDINEFFDNSNEHIKPLDECSDADCWHTGTKKPNPRGGVLVRFKSKRAMTTANIAHEASHLALMIFDYIGAWVDPNNQEPYAYLVGWITKCINEVKKYK